MHVKKCGFFKDCSHQPMIWHQQTFQLINLLHVQWEYLWILPENKFSLSFADSHIVTKKKEYTKCQYITLFTNNIANLGSLIGNQCYFDVTYTHIDSLHVIIGEFFFSCKSFNIVLKMTLFVKLLSFGFFFFLSIALVFVSGHVNIDLQRFFFDSFTRNDLLVQRREPTNSSQGWCNRQSS